MENKWVEDLYNRELARLQPILDAIDASPNGSIDINGYVCSKNFRGYNLGADKYGIGMIEVFPEKEYKGNNGTKHKSKKISYHAEMDAPLGDVIVSSQEESTRVRNIGLDSIPEYMSEKTILETALKYYERSLNTPYTRMYGNDFSQKLRTDIQKVLVMMKSLGIELTQEENMAFLRGRKEELETELAQVNEQLNQKDSQQK